jgi:hypothetical protein
MTTDLTRPVLIATLPATGGPPCPLLNNEDHPRSADLGRPILVVKIRELDSSL